MSAILESGTAEPQSRESELNAVLAEWRRFLDSVPLAGILPPVIVESWLRSREAGVAPDVPLPELHRVGGEDLARRLDACAELVAIARPHLEWVSASLGSVPHVAYLTDADGIVLDSVGIPSLMEAFGLLPGYDWSERRMGTNGAGTALASGQPVAVVGAQHYVSAFHDCTCSAAPLRGPDGVVVGALDVSTSFADGRPEQLILAAHAAFGIERELAHREDLLQAAREAVHESNARLKVVLDNTTAVIYLVDTRNRLVLINRQWERLFGVTNDEAAGRSIYEIFPAEFADAFAAHNRRVMETGEPLEIEEAAPHGDGVHTYLSIKVPVFDAAGGVRAICGISTDITERRQTQDRIERLYRQLVEVDRRKDEFLATLAHELRNPMASISNASRILALRAAQDSSLGWCVEVIERQVGQLARLVDDLLDVSRITRGRIELRREPVDLAAVVERAVETSRPFIEERSHRLSTMLPGEPLVASGDAVRLAQVISNLLHNAAKYTDDGGQIWVSLERQNGEGWIAVRDSGIGISEEVLPRVFDLFSQGEPGLDRADGGLGIGLSLVKSLVEMHGGSVEAYSLGRGKGSELVVRLPLLQGGTQPVAGGEIPEVERRSLPKRRVLVVDDNLDAAESLAELLRLLGQDARAVFGGEAALLEARSFRPEVVLLDIGMPGMDGHEVARRLRAEEHGAMAALVALTGYGQEADRQLSLDAGFDLHLVKPVGQERLERLLTEL